METVSPSKQDDILCNVEESFDDDAASDKDDSPVTPQTDNRNGQARTPASRIYDLSHAISSIATPGASSKLIHETMQEFGNMISQRKNELSAMRKSGSKSDSGEKQGVSLLSEELRPPSISAAIALASDISHVVNETPIRRVRILEDRQESRDSTPFRRPRRIDTDGPRSTSKDVYSEMLDQLHGEKHRVNELNSKINEMHLICEENRERAAKLTRENERLEHTLKEQAELLRLTRSTVEEMQLANERKTERIRELELLLQQATSAESRGKDALAEYETRMNALELEKTNALVKLEQMTEQYKRTSHELHSANHSLHEYSKYVARCEYLEEEKLSLSQRIQHLDSEFHQLSHHNEKLMQHNKHLIEQNERDAAEVERIRHQHATISAEFEEMSRSNCKLMEQIERMKISKADSDHRATAALQRSDTINEQLEAMETEVLALRERVRELESVPPAVVSTSSAPATVSPAKVKKSDTSDEDIRAIKTLHEREKQALRIQYNSRQRSHTLQITSLLMAVLVLLCGLGLSYVIDFQPCSLDAYRITS